MNLSKLAKRLRREAVGSPKKAAVLGLLVLVGLYFWAPLVGTWFSKSESTTTGVASPAATPSPAAATPPAATTGEGRLRWQEVVKLIETDPRTRPTPLALARDPFATPPKPQLAEKPEEAETTATPPPQLVTPGTLGLSLVGTMVGTTRRAARLGGKTVVEGQVIEIAKDGQRYQFMLAEVDPRRVVLTRDGERFELSIKEPGRSGQIEILPND